MAAEHEQGSGSARRFPLPELFIPEEWQTLAAKLRLTPRQVEVARLICLGLSKQEIAQELRLSEATARLHVKELFKRLKINDRVGVPVRLVLATRARLDEEISPSNAPTYPNG